MPSEIGKEDLRAELYKAGIKDPAKLNAVMRLAEIYALTVHRKLVGLSGDDVPPPTFTPLSPGEWNVALEITCCVKCSEVKRWKYFHLDGQHVTGHKTTCKSCRGRENDISPGEVRRGGWICSGPCGRRRAPDEFPPEKRMSPRKAIPCLYCEPDT